jgi:hypothetical protein
MELHSEFMEEWKRVIEEAENEDLKEIDLLIEKYYCHVDDIPRDFDGNRKENEVVLPVKKVGGKKRMRGGEEQPPLLGDKVNALSQESHLPEMTIENQKEPPPGGRRMWGNEPRP